jgi:hypothetical protein
MLAARVVHPCKVIILVFQLCIVVDLRVPPCTVVSRVVHPCKVIVLVVHLCNLVDLRVPPCIAVGPMGLPYTIFEGGFASELWGS